MDVRVLAATNRDLAALVRQGLFREDLFYRLSTITVELPPAARAAGTTSSCWPALRRASERALRVVPDGGLPETLELLRTHDWPGNVRELLHVIEAAMVVCEGAEIRPEHLPSSLRVAPSIPPSRTDEARMPTLQEMERALIERALSESDGHRGNAARALGISERNLYRKLHEYGLLS